MSRTMRIAAAAVLTAVLSAASAVTASADSVTGDSATTTTASISWDTPAPVIAPDSISWD
ncbi:hypothetical protein C3489_11005 [Streptomyces sp. Ru71]|uniref:hypothetical protein n=1 Tax=Streptomyces sp. Ru71 TaxID=2080746 RepID=UPI000CDD27A7|nr:hypothetical protein [Streptomyces sp. Ru71]POX55312.1 hypothetical protein C3489_11005 [Streptomyces sp. Ru71]